jgi:hypothetical protein
MRTNYEIITADNQNVDIGLWEELIVATWPSFMLHDTISLRYRDFFENNFKEFQFAFKTTETSRIIAVGNCIPLLWNKDPVDLPEEGWDWAFEKGCNDFSSRNKPNALCALSASIHPEFQSKGLSKDILVTMKNLALKNNFKSLIVPVRPSMKSRYPLIPLEQYMHWKNEDGLPFDSWIRTHIKLGAYIIKTCKKSMRISGTVDEWTKWTGSKFPGSGRYIIPDALVPIQIDIRKNQGTYVEPSVWVIHKLR